MTSLESEVAGKGFLTCLQQLVFHSSAFFKRWLSKYCVYQTTSSIPRFLPRRYESAQTDISLFMKRSETNPKLVKVQQERQVHF